MPDIPNDVAQVSNNEGDIPKIVAELPQETDALETRPYLISFSKYNDRLCEISLLTSNKARKAVETLKTVGTKIRSQADFQRNSIDRIPVRYAGEYKKLFNGLSADIELKELKLQQSARIFYFDIEPERTFYVVAITENHLETEQTRR
jgi:hypothetical protein